MVTDYKEKIRKLLALAESPNENEAKLALLKARQLMAEYKLSEAEVKDLSKQEVQKVVTDIFCSSRKNPWILPLSEVISENYCCKAFSRKEKYKQIRQVGFIGFRDDVEVCIAIFKYAMDCINSGIKIIRHRYGSSKETTIQRNNYAIGFVNGIEVAFQRQQQENQSAWGLILTTPQQVLDAISGMEKQHYRPKVFQTVSRQEYFRGLEEGKKFDPTTKLSSEVNL